MKTNKCFVFEPVIYADKYLLEKEQDKNVEEQVARLRVDQAKVRDQIEGYNKYYKGVGIVDMIQ